MLASFPALCFRGRLRPSQEEVVAIAREQLAEGETRLHIVAPPGSGKTVLGLYLWAAVVKEPAVVLSPNSAIQSQWAARVDLFDMDGGSPRSLVSTDSGQPGLLTSLTYQAVTLPRRGDEDLDRQAVELWCDRLVEKEQAEHPDEARVWIEDLRQHNREYYEDRLSAYRKEVRDAVAIGGDALATLHESSMATLRRLADRGVKFLILDECHHLMGHWGRVLADVHRFLGDPVVLGLTATPPDRDGRLPEDVARYDAFFGPVDYEVPVPALVRDGFLAPYQDLAFFVRPTGPELTFIANTDEELTALVEELCTPPREENAPEGAAGQTDAPPDDAPGTARTLPEWLLRVVKHRWLPTGTMPNWTRFEQRDPSLAYAARVFLTARGVPLPEDVPSVEIEYEMVDPDGMEILVPVLDRYIRHRLRRSGDPKDHELAERAIRRLRGVGVQVTETGSQACASPVNRVMAYGRGKTAAIVPILKSERAALGERIRAVVIADYERTSAVAEGVEHILDNEAGGAVAAFRSVLSDEETDALDPVLVTGSCVLVDDDLSPRFMDEAGAWLKEHGFGVKLQYQEQQGFNVLVGRGNDWCPRVYVNMITTLFQQGVTRCLVGTRGLLGEGWDATKANVLIDLTTVTTSMTVNQLRGRSIRLDPDDPQKLANNWDVVCIAPEFRKGLEDYRRFIAKHKTLFGVTDDGAIEKGVGHVHAAFTELRPEGLEGSVVVLNEEMLGRAGWRPNVRDLWRIGEPYHSTPIRAVEVKPLRENEPPGFPPFARSDEPWSARSLALAVGEAVVGALAELDMIKACSGVCAGERAGNYVRLFLEEAGTEDMRRFTECVEEALGPLRRPRYVIPRHVDMVKDNWLSRLLPGILGRYFEKRRRMLVMWHAVPGAFAGHKDTVAVFQRHWNEHVSPGEAVYAHRGKGEEIVEAARRQGLTPRGAVHTKDIFF